MLDDLRPQCRGSAAGRSIHAAAACGSQCPRLDTAACDCFGDRSRRDASTAAVRSTLPAGNLQRLLEQAAWSTLQILLSRPRRQPRRSAMAIVRSGNASGTTDSPRPSTRACLYLAFVGSRWTSRRSPIRSTSQTSRVPARVKGNLDASIALEARVRHETHPPALPMPIVSDPACEGDGCRTSSRSGLPNDAVTLDVTPTVSHDSV